MKSAPDVRYKTTSGAYFISPEDYIISKGRGEVFLAPYVSIAHPDNQWQ